MRVVCGLGLILESVTVPKGANELKDVVAAILGQSNWKSLLQGVSRCDRYGGDVIVK
jgi:hypothetical protein